MLSQQNANCPKGSSPTTNMTTDILANDQLLKADEYQPLIVGYHNGAAVKLSDIADGQDSVENIRTAGFLNGKPAFLDYLPPARRKHHRHSRSRQSGASVAQGFHPLGDRHGGRAGSHDDHSGVGSRCGTHPADCGRAGDFGRVCVSAQSASDPDSQRCGSGLAHRHFWGDVSARLQFDNLSLMALTISTGFVVDDAIVVIENVSRHLEEGMSPLEAALIGARKSDLPCFRSAFRWSQSLSPSCSWAESSGDCFANSRYALNRDSRFAGHLTDDDADDVFAAAEIAKTGRARTGFRAKRKFFRACSCVLRTQPAVVLQHPAITLVCSSLTIVPNVYLFVMVPKGFFPQQDNGTVFGGIQGSQDASFQAMQPAAVRFVRFDQNGSGGFRRGHFHRRQRRDQQRLCLRRAQAIGGTECDLKPDHQPMRPKLVGFQERRISAGRTGRAHRWTAKQRAVSIHHSKREPE